MTQLFNTSSSDRLNQFLSTRNFKREFEKLTPDASTREYFRIRSNGKTLVACLYPGPFDQTLPQIDVTKLFLTCGLPVARIIEIDYALGVILQEDFGDRILRELLETADPNKRDELTDRAISLIARIQHATPRAVELESIASKLKFDEEKLFWELTFFRKHYFESLRKMKLDEYLEDGLTKEFTQLSREIEGYARVLTHRDFHAANLMVDDRQELKIIDHQDARLGSIAYDLVSLLLDRINEAPASNWLIARKRVFLSEREKLGLHLVDTDDFDYEFDLVTVQRCLKAIGTFSNQAANAGKRHYIRFIDPMFSVVLKACQNLDKYPVTQRVIKGILN